MPDAMLRTRSASSPRSAAMPGGGLLPGLRHQTVRLLRQGPSDLHDAGEQGIGRRAESVQQLGRGASTLQLAARHAEQPPEFDVLSSSRIERRGQLA